MKKLRKIILPILLAFVFVFVACSPTLNCLVPDDNGPKDERTVIQIPVLEENEFEYDGERHTVVLDEAGPFTLGGTTYATDIGNFVATVSLNCTDTYVWADGTDTAKSLPWSIVAPAIDDREIIQIPSLLYNEFYYNSEPHTIELDADGPFTLTGDTTETAIGNYDAVVMLDDPTLFVWANGTDTAITLPWSIVELVDPRTEVAIPALVESEFMYTGSAITVALNATGPFTLGGQYSRTDVGNYTATVSLNDTGTHKWADGTDGPKNLYWSITPFVDPRTEVAIPALVENEFYYTGLPITVELTITGVFNTGGTTTATAAGNYAVIVSLPNLDDYKWTDGTNGNRILPWRIVTPPDIREEVAIPSLVESLFTYTGSAITVALNATGPFTLGGQYSMTAIGDYVASVSLNDTGTHRWADGTDTPIALPWKIEPAILPGSLPKVHIDVNMNQIQRDPWTTTSVAVTNSTNNVSGLQADVRGRGNSTWAMSVAGPGGWPNGWWAGEEVNGKRPFRLRFNSPVAMLDSAVASAHWTFIANHSDKSLLRTYSAYYLARSMTAANRMIFAPSARLVSVYMNGTYQGIYMMSDQLNQVNQGRITLESRRANVFEDTEILIEACGRADSEGPEWNNFIRINNEGRGGQFWQTDSLGNNKPFVIEFPTGGGNRQAIAHDLQQYLQTVSNYIMTRNWAQIQNHVHIPSFVDFYIVNELFKNVDIGFSSVWYTIRGFGADRRIHAGPVWDFDIAAGNCYYVGSPVGTAQNARVSVNHPWFRELMSITEFRAVVAARWNEVRDAQVQGMLNRITYRATTYAAEFTRSHDRWGILNGGRGQGAQWPSPNHLHNLGTHQAHVEHLLGWFTERIAWFNGFLG